MDTIYDIDAVSAALGECAFMRSVAEMLFVNDGELAVKLWNWAVRLQRNLRLRAHIQSIGNMRVPVLPLFSEAK
jgi:hypothetical protein